MSKNVVTGGAGFIGSNVAAALIARGHEVTVVDDLSSGHLVNLTPLEDVELLKGSVLDEGLLEEAMAGADTVFHLAASVGNKRSIDNPLDDAAVNLLGTLSVLEAARHAGVRKVVYSSSAAAFGELIHLPIAEDHPLDPDSPYGVSKLAGEKAALVYQKMHDLEVAALRYFNVYGPNQRYDQYGNVIPIFATQMLANEAITIFGDGEQTRDFLNVADVVQANLKAAAPGISGVFNIGSGASITINALAAMLQGLIGTDGVIRYGPPRAGDVRHSTANIDAARAAFGFEPDVSLDVGLAEYVDWLRRAPAIS